MGKAVIRATLKYVHDYNVGVYFATPKLSVVFGNIINQMTV